jgi:hypothetical protein
MSISFLKDGISYYYFPCDEAHQDVITYLTALAVEQDALFKDIWPWRRRCEPDQFVYIALRLPEYVSLDDMMTEKMNPDIYGWMQMTVSTWHKRRIAYVNEVSVRMKTEPSRFKGIGTTLLWLLENHMRLLSVDFIYLFPLLTAVGFYEKLEYKPCLGVDGMPSPYMCKVLNKAPTRSYARYRLQKRIEDLAADDEIQKEMVEEVINEIRSQLNERERQLFDVKASSDDTFIQNVIYIYQDEDGGIDDVRDLLSEPIPRLCPEGKEINPKTGRCVKSCKPEQVRSVETGRCVSKKSSSPKRRVCPSGKEINPKSGRCVNLCKAGQVRNKDTGRCSKRRKK